jgi:hypothetical protein
MATDLSSKRHVCGRVRHLYTRQQNTANRGHWISAAALAGFSNPKNNDPEHGLVYDKQADQRSCKAMQDFFNETFAN